MGPLGNPFAQLAYPQITTPFGTVAAWLGASGVTTLLAFVGASIAAYYIDPRRGRRLCIELAFVAAILIAASLTFPARTLAAPTFPVAVVQGNIRQDLKWTQAAFDLAVERYLSLTKTLVDLPNTRRPQLIVWPETVIPTDLNADESLQLQFTHLAQYAHATLVVGSLERRKDVPYNSLWYFKPDGTQVIYRKRRLVPFAEWLPAEALLSAIPVTNLVSRFGSGSDPAVIPVGTHRTAPLICWESGFSNLLHSQLRKGADLTIVSTDDAWFGTSAGPYQHAQISQMRAIESGTWIVRAAATGISGIIAPDGTFTQRSVVNQIEVVQGLVGTRVPTVFSIIGPLPVTIGLFVIYAALLTMGWLWRRRARS